MIKAKKSVLCGLSCVLIFCIPMFAMLYACASVNKYGIREKGDKDMIKLNSWIDTGAISTSQVNHITLTGEEGSEFVCSTSSNDAYKEGNFWYYAPAVAYGTSITVSSGTTVYWSCLFYDDTGMQIVENETIWLEFVNRKNTDIIGYAVVRVDKISDYHYNAEVVKAVTFPKVNGEYQAVTEEQVNQLIDSIER